jgi:glycosyltransferase involved in cell wall biosynthesis
MSFINDQLIKLSVIVPIYNEELNIALFYNEITSQFLESSDVNLELIFINDGSSDKSISILKEYLTSNPQIKIIDFSRNFGKEAALTAGLKVASGDVAVLIDADLQHPPVVIHQMLSKWRDGYQMVIAKRSNPRTFTFFRNFFTSFFYYLHNKVSEIQLVPEAGDFRLLDKSVVDALNQFGESARFMKGIFSWVGFDCAYVEYSQVSRIAGKTNFGKRKLINFAFDGITSFSTAPLRVWTLIGLFFATISFTYAVYIVFRGVTQGIEVPGYVSTVVIVIFLGGLQLIGIGVLGEYIGRTFIEAKKRPLYIIKNIYENKK